MILGISFTLGIKTYQFYPQSWRAYHKIRVKREDGESDGALKKRRKQVSINKAVELMSPYANPNDFGDFTDGMAESYLIGLYGLDKMKHET